MSAPQTAVGAFAEDACNVLASTGLEPVCVLAGTSPATLVDFTALGEADIRQTHRLP